MRIIIEIEDGAVRASHSQGAGQDGAGQQGAVNAGGPPAELLQLLAPRLAPPAQAAAGSAGAAVDVGGPPAELLRALAARPRR